MEQGEEGSVSKAAILITEFKKYFRNIDYTLHPRGIEGEAQGKSSNLRWAAQHLNLEHLKKATQGDVILTVIDGEIPLLIFLLGGYLNIGS